MKILNASCSSSTWNNYKSVLRKWNEFTIKNRSSYNSPSVSDVLLFFTNLYESGLGYSSINLARSALSTVIGMLDGVKLGEHVLVKRFLRGVYKLRPPVPRYKVTWDAGLVLNLFNQWPDNSNLSLVKLSHKLVGLLALCTGQRVQTIHSISVDDIISGNPVQIKLPAILKTTRPGVPNPILTLPFYVDNSKLCIVRTLQEYVCRTEKYRINDSFKQLILTTVKPFKPASRQTISNWLVSILKESGINTDIFKGHSFRHASSSRAAKKGLCTNTIINAVGWSTASTFAKFYNREIVDNTAFAKAILRDDA